MKIRAFDPVKLRPAAVVMLVFAALLLSPVAARAAGQDNYGPSKREFTKTINREFTTTANGTTDLETGVVDRAGTADPGIRSSVGDADTNTVNKGTVTRDIIAAPEGDGGAAQAVIPN